MSKEKNSKGNSFESNGLNGFYGILKKNLINKNGIN